MSPRLSVILPGFNEEANVEPTVARCISDLRGICEDYEIVIVDDASTDTMPERADRLARETPRIRVLHNPVNLHVGLSLLVGLKAASGDLIVHNSMDYPFHLSDLSRALPLLETHDVVIVSRTDRSAHSAWRKLTSFVHWRMVKALFRVPFTDMNFVQVYRAEVLRAVRVQAKSPAFVTPEILIRARDLGFRIAEIRAPFHRRERGVSSYGKPRDILWTLADMIGFWSERRRRAAQGPVTSKTS